MFAESASQHALFLLLVYLTFALSFSFLCSVAEAVLLSVTEPYVVSLREKRPRTAAILDDFRRAPDRPLTAILTLNTVAHTVGAAGVGHEAAVLFGEQWLGLASAIMTVLILIGSEIIPKTLGVRRWRTLAPMAARGVHLLTKLLSPVVSVMVMITERMGGHSRGDLSRDEIRALAAIAAGSRNLGAAEASVLSNLFLLQEKSVHRVMTPRGSTFHLPASMTVADYRREHRKSPYSRIPVYGKNPDDVVGFVLRMDLLAAKDGSLPLERLARPVLSVPDHISVASLYSQLLEQHCHLALVVNEFGDYEGVVTLEDVLEALLGIEITDESDRESAGSSPSRSSDREAIPEP